MAVAPQRWLKREIPEWVRAGILTPEAADRLSERYSLDDADATRAVILRVFLASLGALLIGGGLLLIIAHNWEGLGRPWRAGLALGGLAAAQILAGFAVIARPASKPWAEGAGSLLPIAAAGAIALISQTYQIGGDLGAYNLACAALALPIVYLMESSLAAFLYLMWLFLYLAERANEHQPALLFWGFVAAFLPFPARLAFQRKDWRIPGTTLCILLHLAGLSIATGWSEVRGWMLYFGGLMPALWSLGSALSRRRSGEGAVALQRVALIAAPFVLLPPTFADWWSGPMIAWQDLFHDASSAIGLGSGILMGSAAALASIARIRSDPPSEVLIGSAFLPISVSLVLGSAGLEAFSILAMNLLCAGIALAAILEGIRTLSILRMNAGLGLGAVLGAARFFETDLDFLWRGLIFIVAGLSFLGANVWMTRRRRARGTGGSP